MEELEEEVNQVDKKIGLKFNRPEGILTYGVHGLKDAFLRRRSSYEQDEDLVNRVEESGISLENVLEEEKAKEVREKLRSKVRNDDEPFLESMSIRPDDEEAELFSDVLNSQRVENHIRSIFGTDFGLKDINVLHYLNNEDNSEKRTTAEWHLDIRQRHDCIRLLLYLTEHGDSVKLQTVSREESEELLEKFSPEELRDKGDQLLEHADISRLGGSLGEGILFNPALNLHRGEIPEPGEERMIAIFTFHPEPDF